MKKFFNYINIKNRLTRKIGDKKLSDKQGVVLAETILLIGISLVVIITIFYPTFRNIVNDTLAAVSNWYDSALTNIGIQ